MIPALRASEKRSEIRRPARGHVTIRTAGPTYVEFEGQLVDVSISGFRMRHEGMLETGSMVDFWHTEAAGRARVVWNRISNARVETGFFIVERN